MVPRWAAPGSDCRALVRGRDAEPAMHDALNGHPTIPVKTGLQQQGSAWSHSPPVEWHGLGARAPMAPHASTSSATWKLLCSGPRHPTSTVTSITPPIFPQISPISLHVHVLPSPRTSIFFKQTIRREDFRIT